MDKLTVRTGSFAAACCPGQLCPTRKSISLTSNLLSNGAAPKDVQELLGRADVNTTMNIYAHDTREAKRTSTRLLDKVVCGE